MNARLFLYFPPELPFPTESYRIIVFLFFGNSGAKTFSCEMLPTENFRFKGFKNFRFNGWIYNFRFNGWVYNFRFNGWIYNFRLNGWIYNFRFNGWIYNIRFNGWIYNFRFNGWIYVLTDLKISSDTNST